MSKLLLIESPGKLRKLSQILGRDWVIKASMGHVRELANDGEDALGFDLTGDRIDCRYEPRGTRGKAVLAELRKAVKAADQVYIATDPDREGETIGWHLQQALRLKNPYRVTYREITAESVKAAIAHPRQLNPALVAAGRARDCLDKLVGYKGSKHIVWKLKIGAKSMGRVQSATLHLLCQREREILAFKPQNYWAVWVEYQEGFKAFYRSTGKPNAVQPTEADDAIDAKQQNPTAPESDRVSSQAEADRLVAIAKANPHQVLSVEGKLATQSPPPPFTTASLQQAAGQKLKFSPDYTMKIAQSLYEAGLITYMRTDSVTLAESFCAMVRAFLSRHDPQNVPNKTANHRSRSNAQEAHEAIRPTEIDRTAQQLADASKVSGDGERLYDLIWNRTIASQCAPVQLQKTRIMTQAGETHWEARGQVVVFVGYTRYWNNLSADCQLPTVQRGQMLQLQSAESEQKQTQPPPRYTEPKLVQLMERKGIGRPSTYAPTVKTLQEREYVAIAKGKLQPTALGLTLDAALEQLLPDLITPEFTAKMESDLDRIAEGHENWEQYLTQWYRNYFSPAIHSATHKMMTGDIQLQSMQFQALQLQATQSIANSEALSEIPIADSNHSRLDSPSKPATKTRKSSATASGKGTTRSSTPRSKTAKSTASSAKPAKTKTTAKTSSKSAAKTSKAIVIDPNAFTNHPCPVCGALLEQYSYVKDGNNKIMLRCSIRDHRFNQCKDVAFFQSKNEFWSPKFGTLN